MKLPFLVLCSIVETRMRLFNSHQQTGDAFIAGMASSKKWATTISRTASSLYFLLIFTQVPLFRVPCRGSSLSSSSSPSCTTPLELTCSQLLSSQVFPAPVVELLLYPGAIAKAIFKNKPIPEFRSLPKIYKFIRMKTPPASPFTSDLHRLEVIAGSYLAVGGAMMGMVRPGSGRMSLFGCLVAMWGIVWRKSAYYDHNKQYSRVYPTMFLAVLLAFLSVRKDVRRIVRCVKAQGNPSWKKKFKRR
ncbi:uncharacterized protein LOC111455879 [Cucurbita moschata]|uniref:Uncharacterized protein LOC111455879 n=1 Tax=Cucurbita moschata TaxID=3662 RepID=A0A6J1GMZ9_CUCMO|nr:uncharacterized protein LOC111455879 [Cucurbita moschata]